LLKSTRRGWFAIDAPTADEVRLAAPSPALADKHRDRFGRIDLIVVDMQAHLPSAPTASDDMTFRADETPPRTGAAPPRYTAQRYQLDLLEFGKMKADRGSVVLRRDHH
jgi:hypothetical protein